MSLQTVDGIDNVFVVDFDTMPELPITWSTAEEEPYARSLDDAIRTGKITEPGKYGIVVSYIDDANFNYSLSKILEP
jgi:hypothetical protein